LEALSEAVDALDETEVGVPNIVEVEVLGEGEVGSSRSCIGILQSLGPGTNEVVRATTAKSTC